VHLGQEYRTVAGCERAENIAELPELAAVGGRVGDSPYACRGIAGGILSDDIVVAVADGEEIAPGP
jgi:hypothetical protein